MPTCSQGWTIQTKSTGTGGPDPAKAAASASSRSAQLGKTRRALCHGEAHPLGSRELSGNAVTYAGQCRPRGRPEERKRAAVVQVGLGEQEGAHPGASRKPCVESLGGPGSRGC